MSFDRKRVQETCEAKLSNSRKDFALLRNGLKNKVLTPTDIADIRAAADLDIKDYYFKSLVSLFGALYQLPKGNFSWATIKLYYSVYYLLQVEMLARGTVLVRSTNIYRLILKPGEQFTGKRNIKFNKDHSGTILHFIELYKTADPLMSNTINGEIPYNWLMSQRERINYRERHFSEPSAPDFWQGPVSLGLDEQVIEKTIQTYLDDSTMSLIFQEDHAILGIPLKRLQETVSVLSNYGYSALLDADQKDFLNTLKIGTNLDPYVNF